MDTSVPAHRGFRIREPESSIPELLDLMEPLHFEDDGDRRLELTKTGGGTLRVNMIRIRRPEGARDEA